MTSIASGPRRRARAAVGADVHGEALAGLAVEVEVLSIGLPSSRCRLSHCQPFEHGGREVAVLAVKPQVALDALARAAAGQLADREHTRPRIIRGGAAAKCVVVAAAVVVRDDAAAVRPQIEGALAEREAQAVASDAAERRGLPARLGGVQREAALDATRRAEPEGGCRW